MKIAVCEDEISNAQALAALVEKFMIKNEVEFKIDLFLSGEELLSKNADYDLIFLDCVLPGKNGLELAKELRRQGKKSTIVFVTAFADFVFESFEVGTFRYILKPISEKKINKVLCDFLNGFKEEKYINIPTARKDNIVNINQIIYIESDGKYSIVRLSNNNFYKSIKPISFYQQEIAEVFGSFFRTHRRFIVNMDYIEKINGNIIVFSNGENAEISRRNLSAFNDKYVNFLKHSVN